MFSLLFRYIQFVHDYIYYKRVYYVNKEKVPPVGSSLLIVSNHQNAINDPLALEFCFEDRAFYIFARASLFASKFGNHFFRGLKVLPAYRLRTDGEEALSKNESSFSEAGEVLLNGGAIGIFPEATNQDRHWLGDFSQAYLRLAFETAKRSNFEHEIYIQPVATHYSDYFKFRADMMIVCGDPIALSTYYKSYTDKPRTTCRNLNQLIRERVSEMMLDIRDSDNYEAIDYLRETYGIKFAKKHGLNPDVLPEKLKADKELTARLQKLHDDNEECAHKIYEDALELKRKTLSAGLKDKVFDLKHSKILLCAEALAFVLLFPLFVFALYPNIAAYLAPMPMNKKYREMGGAFTMFQSGVQLGFNSIITIPLCYLIVFIADILLFGWIVALVHLVCLPPLGLFAWSYSRKFKKFRGTVRYLRKKDSPEVVEIAKLRRELYDLLDDLIGITH